MNTLKNWLIGSVVGLIVTMSMFYYLLQGHWLLVPMVSAWLIAVPTFLFLFGLLEDSAIREGKNRRRKTGEDAPKFEQDYEGGRVVVYGDTVKIYHGSQNVRFGIAAFLELADDIKKTLTPPTN